MGAESFMAFRAQLFLSGSIAWWFQHRWFELPVGRRRYFRNGSVAHAIRWFPYTLLQPVGKSSWILRIDSHFTWWVSCGRQLSWFLLLPNGTCSQFAHNISCCERRWHYAVQFSRSKCGRLLAHINAIHAAESWCRWPWRRRINFPRRRENRWKSQCLGDFGSNAEFLNINSGLQWCQFPHLLGTLANISRWHCVRPHQSHFQPIWFEFNSIIQTKYKCIWQFRRIECIQIAEYKPACIATISAKFTID